MNLAELTRSFHKTMRRTDVTDEDAHDYINLSMGRIQRRLRAPINERHLTVTIGSSFDGVDVPSDLLEIKHFYSPSGEKLTRPEFGYFMSMPPVSGNPYYFVRSGANYLIKPTPAEGSKLDLIYYGELSKLEKDTDENELSVIAPDLIKYGALSFAADDFLDDRGQKFEARYKQFMEEIDELAEREEFGGGARAVAPPSDVEF